MRPSISSKTASTLSCLLFAILPSWAHMQMSWPYPIRSEFNPMNSYSNIDYSMTSPLLADGSNFPCKGYQNDRPVQTTATYSAGLTYNMTLAGTATHGGGSCQISLSYDNGATFRVIKSMIGGCPLTSTYDFTIPSYAPSGNALLAWTWQNEHGNREFYMNCASVDIDSSAKRRRRRLTYSIFDNLPFIWRANLAGLNDCSTAEGEDPVYPSGGPDVVNGNGLSSSSLSSPGDCDSPTPYGQTYRDLGDSTVASPASDDDTTSSESTDPPSGASDPASPPPQTSASDTSPQSGIQTGAIQHPQKNADPAESDPSESTSTTTITIGCESTPSPFTYMMTSTITINTASPLPTAESPPYAPDTNSYLSCVPVTFLCTSTTTWQTCDYNDGSISSTDQTFVYLYPRSVAAGMMCLPSLSPYSANTQQYGQQANVPTGSYRDDVLVRARPDGQCDQDGSIQCTDGGLQFDLCDQGGWVQMGSVAAGTVCSDGEIVAA